MENNEWKLIRLSNKIEQVPIRHAIEVDLFVVSGNWDTVNCSTFDGLSE